MKNQKTYLEHANITTSSIEKSLEFLEIIFPDFYVRHRENDEIKEWLHFGNEYFYIALNERNDKNKIETDYDTNGIKHLGFVVENLEEKGLQLEKLGYKRSYPIVEHKYRRREYFYNHDGIDFELIEYYTNNDEERNDYSE